MYHIIKCLKNKEYNLQQKGKEKMWFAVKAKKS